MKLIEGDFCLFKTMDTAKVNSIDGGSVRFATLHSQEFRDLLLKNGCSKFIEFKSEDGVNYRGMMTSFEESGFYDSIYTGDLELHSIEVIGKKSLIVRLKEVVISFLCKIKLIKGK
tara:strand:- start:1 stop:348 length:348 start_codon:yes stop_codon:yes gene_type:complete